MQKGNCALNEPRWRLHISSLLKATRLCPQNGGARRKFWRLRLTESCCGPNNNNNNNNNVVDAIQPT
ncbi:hypothetical protein D9C73_023571 [Collichthys lucidus]|uniref:Uncharacterized protein n=1 Tax=Collichthys lucidus TaxID=240159 RepID=A0A4U5VM44_COLLU|nr:hypothetical protein D9C73_023571 [Collichthys lucidus]